jgi:hypothetical protein
MEDQSVDQDHHSQSGRLIAATLAGDDPEGLPDDRQLPSRPWQPN